MYFFEKFLEFIFLPSCGICGKLGEGYLCKECEKQLAKYRIKRKITGYYFYTKSRKNKNILKKESIFRYNKKRNCRIEIYKFHVFYYRDLIRKLILDYKFNDKSYLYKTFCDFIEKDKKILDFIKRYDIIIPVPMHKSKIRKRGYNQSELIAKELAKRLGIKVYTDVLIKIKNNKVQSTLNKKEREENTKNVYKLINSEKINNKKILIFDDIYTTGATINSCIKEIQKAGVVEIGVLTLAKD